MPQKPFFHPGKSFELCLESECCYCTSFGCTAEYCDYKRMPKQSDDDECSLCGKKYGKRFLSYSLGNQHPICDHCIEENWGTKL